MTFGGYAKINLSDRSLHAFWYSGDNYPSRGLTFAFAVRSMQYMYIQILIDIEGALF